MSERKQKYRAGSTTVADEPTSITLKRSEWVHVVVALRIVGKQTNSREDLRLSRVVGDALSIPQGALDEQDG